MEDVKGLVGWWKNFEPGSRRHSPGRCGSVIFPMIIPPHPSCGRPEGHRFSDGN